MKLCIHCVSYGGQEDYVREICKDPRNIRPDYIRGGRLTYDASWLRSLDRDDTCGPDAKWFVPKNEGNWFPPKEKK
jgi:hypothetical protein